MSYWIVVVDDDAMALRHAKNLLKEQDMRVSCLRSGSDFLKFMETNTPDLVLLDILMPEMDGFTCYHLLRQAEEKQGRSATPVIFVTGDRDRKNERQSLKYGASDFIHKPLDKDILISRIEKTVENHKTIENLTQKATVDKLTGFLNKASGTKKIEEMCSEMTGALVLFDMDNFKLVNDIYGHEMGDKVLQAFADVMRANTRLDDVISRIGGDEFLAFFVDLTQKSTIHVKIHRLNEQLWNKCVELVGADFNIPIGISAGASFAPEHSRDYTVLFRNADSAMYQAKQNGKHTAEIYDKAEMAQIQAKEASGDDDIAHITRIMEERGKHEGALALGKDVFVHTYQFAVRLMEKYGKDAVKMLFTISTEGEVEYYSQITSDFQEVMRKKLRSEDIMVHLKADQIFALLSNVTLEDAQKLKDGIMEAWEKEYQGGGDIY